MTQHRRRGLVNHCWDISLLVKHYRVRQVMLKTVRIGMIDTLSIVTGNRSRSRVQLCGLPKPYLGQLFQMQEKYNCIFCYLSPLAGTCITSRSTTWLLMTQWWCTSISSPCSHGICRWESLMLQCKITLKSLPCFKLRDYQRLCNGKLPTIPLRFMVYSQPPTCFKIKTKLTLSTNGAPKRGVDSATGYKFCSRQFSLLEELWTIYIW